MSETMQPFSPVSPLRRGTTLIEASAGTGKTYNITNLFLRLVAEQGLRADQILVVTFTNAATAELRERVRVRLGQAVAALLEVEAGRPAPDDPVLAQLAADGPCGTGAAAPDRALRLRRLRQALEEYDTASIYTIHSFCQRMLQLFAFESDAAFGSELTAELTPLFEEIVDDHLSRTLSEVSEEACRLLVGPCGLRRDALLDLAKLRAQCFDAPLLPALPCTRPWPAELAGWQADVEEFRRRWQQGGRREAVALIEDEITRSKAKKAAPKRLARLYTAGKAEKSACALDEWLDGVTTPCLPDRAWVTFFCQGQVACDQAEPLLHPLYAAWEQIVEGAQRLRIRPRLEFAAGLDERLRSALEQRNGLSFADLLRRLRDKLVDPRSGPALLRGIRARYRAALIDEFQDTDEVQWAIFSRLFQEDPSAYLYLIGDPKQAIYSFRGADVFVYQRAKEVTALAQRATMTVNQRSDGRYVAAMNCLFGDRQPVFDLPFIDYVPVQAADRHLADRLRHPQGPAPLQLRWFDRGAQGPADPGEPLSKPEAWRLVPKLVAQDVLDLLRSGAELQDEEGRWRPLAAADLAVLVRKNKQASAVQQALLARGVPAIIGNAGSVLDSEEALAIERWLEAVLAAGQDAPARALAVSSLIGWSATELHQALNPDQAQDGLDPARRKDWSGWIRTITAWKQALEQSGFSRAFAKTLQDEAVLERLFGLPDGERRVTNLRHLVDLLHAAATREHLGGEGLLHWLHDQREQAAGRDERASDELLLRLESDADAVRVVTLHGSKGLQYPVVFLPYLWDGHPFKNSAIRFHDPQDGHRLKLSFDGPTAAGQDPAALASREELQENLRLLYVAFTRARHQVVAYAGTPGGSRSDYPASPLGILLHGGQAGEGVLDRPARALERFAEGPEALLADLQTLAAASVGPGGAPTISVARCTPPGTSRLACAGAGADPGGLAARVFSRAAFDHAWRRLSYSTLTRGQESALPVLGLAQATTSAAELEGRDLDAQAADITPTGLPGAVSSAAELALLAATPAGAAGNVPLFDFPRGKEAGTFVHKVFEELDFCTRQRKSDRRQELPELIASLGRRMGFEEPRWHAALAQQLPEVLATPLGPALNDLRLKDIPCTDRLDELKFDLPLAGGDRWRPGVPKIGGEELAACFALRPGDATMPQGYIDFLQDEQRFEFTDLCGFLNGSIDLIFRLPKGCEGASAGRWFVADYKTNRLGPRREEAPDPQAWTPSSTPDHYSPSWMVAEMQRHNYYIQYHLYLVALHRYLRQRLGERYDYSRDVGGALYLFVRGMLGPDAPRSGGQVHGVFFDKPPAEVIERISALFDRNQGGEA